VSPKSDPHLLFGSNRSPQLERGIPENTQAAALKSEGVTCSSHKVAQIRAKTYIEGIRHNKVFNGLVDGIRD